MKPRPGFLGGSDATEGGSPSSTVALLCLVASGIMGGCGPTPSTPTDDSPDAEFSSSDDMPETGDDGAVPDEREMDVPPVDSSPEDIASEAETGSDDRGDSDDRSDVTTPDIPIEVVEQAVAAVKDWCITAYQSAIDGAGPCNNTISDTWPSRVDARRLAGMRDVYCTRTLPQAVAAGIRAGMLTVDVEAITRCRDEDQLPAPCGVLSRVGRPWDILRGCPGGVRGTLGVGEPCSGYLTCGPDSLCRVFKSPYVCVETRVPGESCHSTDSSIICATEELAGRCPNAQSPSAICVPSGAIGDSCKDDGQCLRGALCGAGRCRRSVPARDDFRCGPTENPDEWASCTVDRVCVITGDVGACIVSNVGDACDTNECGVNQSCIDGQCVPGRFEGESCSRAGAEWWNTYQGDCAFGLECVDGFCIAPFSVPDGKVSHSPLRCQSGGMDPETGVCLDPALLGVDGLAFAF